MLPAYIEQVILMFKPLAWSAFIIYLVYFEITRRLALSTKVP